MPSTVTYTGLSKHPDHLGSRCLQLINVPDLTDEKLSSTKLTEAELAPGIAEVPTLMMRLQSPHS